jgi:hypothetical protein
MKENMKADRKALRTVSSWRGADSSARFSELLDCTFFVTCMHHRTQSSSAQSFVGPVSGYGLYVPLHLVS